MIREGGAFHWIGYETAPRRTWNIKLYFSTNLADWEFRGDAGRVTALACGRPLRHARDSAIANRSRQRRSPRSRADHPCRTHGQAR
jgi:hypothetical protein